jgi:hypothetical protein
MKVSLKLGTTFMSLCGNEAVKYLDIMGGIGLGMCGRLRDYMDLVEYGVG